MPLPNPGNMPASTAHLAPQGGNRPMVPGEDFQVGFPRAVADPTPGAYEVHRAEVVDPTARPSRSVGVDFVLGVGKALLTGNLRGPSRMTVDGHNVGRQHDDLWMSRLDRANVPALTQRAPDDRDQFLPFFRQQLAQHVLTDFVAARLGRLRTAWNRPQNTPGEFIGKWTEVVLRLGAVGLAGVVHAPKMGRRLELVAETHSVRNPAAWRRLARVKDRVAGSPRDPGDPDATPPIPPTPAEPLMADWQRWAATRAENSWSGSGNRVSRAARAAGWYILHGGTAVLTSPVTAFRAGVRRTGLDRLSHQRRRNSSP